MEEEQRVTDIMLRDRYGDNIVSNIYEYNKEKHIKKYNRVCENKFINKFFQQGYRIFSMFYNLSEIARMIKEDNYDPETLIILCRIDVGLKINKEKLFKFKKRNGGQYNWYIRY